MRLRGKNLRRTIESAPPTTPAEAVDAKFKDLFPGSLVDVKIEA